MNRRDFIKKSMSAGIVAGSAILTGDVTKLFADELELVGKKKLPYDLVASKGGEPDKMFDMGIAALGGMKAFVPQNSIVVVKPNIGWDAPPELGANTNPLLIKQILKHCFDAGAKKVYVFDNSCDVWSRTYKNSGIEKAVKDTGGMMIPANSKRYYQKVEINKGQKLSNARVHEQILEADVFINVPVLKHHSSAKLTIGMKNNMGIVWNRGYWHMRGLNQCIADFATFKKPDLTIVDAYNVMKKNGPRGVSLNDVVKMKSQIIAVDPVAADTAAVKLFGMDPEDVSYIKLAHKLGVGTMDLGTLAIKKIMIRA